MKKINFFIALLLFLICVSITAFAEEYTVDANSYEDIYNAIEKANKGDEVIINLCADIELKNTITIEKEISVTVNFKGKQINYVGSTSDTADVAGFYVYYETATLTLNGSNRLNSASTYTHYPDSKRPDMKGTGNLVSLSYGTVYINNMYMYSSPNAFAINCVFAQNNDTYVKITNSVIRAQQGAQRGAITSRGGNKHASQLIKRVLIAEESVIYGGFKGYDYNFNFTKGTSFKNVRFYDFAIVNDCWYSANEEHIKVKLMNDYESAAPMINCQFYTYGGEVSDVSVTTYTGKQNIKLINCTFKGITGKLKGDWGGTAMVFVVIDEPNCQKAGKALVYSGEAISSKEETVTVKAHTLGDKRIPSYPNGYGKEGVYSASCIYCQSIEKIEEKAQPLFINLGYSFNEEKTAFTLGTWLNTSVIREFEENAGTTLEYGVIFGNKNFTINLGENGVEITNGKRILYTDKRCYLVDSIMGGISDETRESELVMDFYFYDGEKIEYSTGELQKLSYEDRMNEESMLTKEVKRLLSIKNGIELKYNEDGSFKVMVLADAHMNVAGDEKAVQEVKDRVKLLVDRENPDLIILTGDNTINSSSEARLRANITAIVSYIEEKKIPWCHVYGNHDHEGALSKEEQQAIYESFDYCISKNEPNLAGVGNYVHAVYNSDGTIGSVIYLLDSGTYASTGGYDFIKLNQIEWYKKTSELLEEYNGGTPIPAIMAFHIPLTENNDAYNNRNNTEIVYEATGNRNEGICSSNTDTSLFETALKRGDVKAIVTGHDHVNDYMYNYYGIKLCSSPNISDLTYYNATVQGARVFDLNVSTIDNIKTYVNYIIERFNPDKYENVLDTDITLEDYSDTKTEIKATGYDVSALNGTVDLEVVQGSDSKLIKVQRSQTGNFEIDILFDEEKFARLGDNKYLIVWVDFTDVDFRKACFGLLSSDGTVPYRTDDKDSNTPFYYMADGTNTWVEKKHGWDGCFGTAQSSSVKGFKGYLALPIEDFLKGGLKMDSQTLITGIYIYADISSNDYANKDFYYGTFYLTDDYKDFFN